MASGATLVLGTVGFVRHMEALQRPWQFLEPVNLAIGLFFGRFPGDLGHAAPVELQVARLLGPAVLAAGVIGAFVRNSLWRLRHLRLATLRGHSVLLGLDARSVALASDLRRRRAEVVILDEFGAEAHIEACRRLGVLLLSGSPRTGAALVAARARQARHIVVFGSTDSASLDLGMVASECLRGAATPRVLVGLGDPGLLERLVREPRVGPQVVDRFTLFSTVGLEARSLLARFPLDGDGIGPGVGTRAFLVLVGDSLLTRCLAQQAARVGHFANDTSVSIWLLSGSSVPGAPLLDVPGLALAADVHHLVADPAVPATWQAVWAAVGAQPSRVTLVFADDDGATNLARAVAVPPLPASAVGCAVVTLSPDHAALAASIGKVRPSVGGRIPLFAAVPAVEAITAENVFHEAMDGMARGIHEHYLQGQRAMGRLDPGRASHQPWDLLSEDFKEANRSQADHIAVKLRSLGLVAVRGASALAFAPTSEQLEALSRAEHRRWNADRHLAGWTRALVLDAARKQTPHLCAWDELSEDVRQWDRRAVQSIPEVLAIAGLGIAPAGPADAGPSGR